MTPASRLAPELSGTDWPGDGWFSQLPAVYQQQLCREARIKSLQPGQFLFHRGDSFCGIYGVYSGQLQISGLQQNGQEALLAFMLPGDWFGEIAFFDQLARTHDARACQPTLLWQLSKPALQQLVQQDPQWWLWLGQLLTSKLRQTFTELEQRVVLSAAERLAQRLLLWSRQQSRLTLSQEQLAQSLNLSRQTTNQLLQALAQQGLIRLHYGAVEILNRQQLAACLPPGSQMSAG